MPVHTNILILPVLLLSFKVPCIMNSGKHFNFTTQHISFICNVCLHTIKGDIKVHLCANEWTSKQISNMACTLSISFKN